MEGICGCATLYTVLEEQGKTSDRRERSALFRRVKYLLDVGADPNSRGLYFNTCSTPLVEAVLYGHLAIVELLIRQGADVNLANEFKVGKFATKVATNALLAVAGCTWTLGLPPDNDYSSQYFEIAKLLIQSGADVNTRDFCHETPLLNAASGSETLRVNLVSLLIEHGADVNVANDNGVTPLIRACGHSRYETAKLLVEHGAKVNTRAISRDAWISLHGLPFLGPKHETALSAARAPYDSVPVEAKLIELLEQNGAVE